MRAQGILAFGLVGFVVLVHAGCGAAECPAGSVGPYDNRDRTSFPHTNQDWICLQIPKPLPLPDLGGDKPVDAPGPKDTEAVAKAAIFIETCLGDTFYGANDWSRNINGRIDLLYGTISNLSSHRAIAERINCLKDKTSGCDAVRECLGILVTPDDPRYAAGCYDGIGMNREKSATDEIINVWANCKGLGLDCRGGLCVVQRELCSSKDELPFCTADGAPRACEYDQATDGYVRPFLPSCTTYGLECIAEPAGAGCFASGPECSVLEGTPSGFADFHSGIECTNATTLRACVRGREELVDCSTLGEGFKCIGGSRPQCGADFQCDYQAWNLNTTCEGPSVQVCNAGVWMAFDCAALGFEPCYEPFGACQVKPSATQF